MTDRPPILSIVIPVYNNESFLPFCLDSLLKHQNVNKDSYEIIIVNDGSTDSSLSIMIDYEKKYCNVRVINQINSGVSAARNKGMSVANGKNIWFVDGDDFIKANCLMSIFDTIKLNMDVYHFQGYMFSQDSFSERLLYTNVEGNTAPDIWTYIFCMDFLNKYKIKFEEGIHYCESQLFINDVNLRIPNCLFENNVFYYYRRNALSVTATNRQKKISGYFDLFELLINRLDGDVYTYENTLQQIESVLRMRFLNAMDDNSIATPEQIKKGKELSRRVNAFIDQHTISNDLRKAFNDYEKLCKSFESKDWKNILLRWRKKYNRKRYMNYIIKHPRRFLMKVLKG